MNDPNGRGLSASTTPRPASTPRTIVVIGAGIVGAAIACRLQAEGHAVTLMDPDPPGEGTSFGNAGSVSPGSIVPLALPGTVRSIPAWLADPLGPLSVSPLHGPRLLPWLIRFWRAGRADRVVPAVRAMQSLNRSSVQAYQALLAEAGAPELLACEGMLHVFRSESAFRASAYGRALRTDHGVEVRTFDRAQIARHSPALSSDYRFGFFLPDGGHVRDPRRVVTTLVGLFESRGGQRLRAAARDFLRQRARVVGVRTSDGDLACDAVVVAAGIASVALVRKLSLRVPVVAERGYHVQITAPGLDVTRPVTDAQAKCVATPMDGGLRIAGTSEFTGRAAAPNWRRAEVLVRHARSMYPDIRVGEPSRWTGSRPSTPDSLPIICEAPAAPGAYLAFGHGHWGLMAAPATAQLVADLIARRPGAIDHRPFHVDRF